MAAAPLISFACRALQLPYATLRVPTTGPCRKDARASFAYTYVRIREATPCRVRLRTYVVWTIDCACISGLLEGGGRGRGSSQGIATIARREVGGEVQ